MISVVLFSDILVFILDALLTEG